MRKTDKAVGCVRSLRLYLIGFAVLYFLFLCGLLTVRGENGTEEKFADAPTLPAESGHTSQEAAEQSETPSEPIGSGAIASGTIASESTISDSAVSNPSAEEQPVNDMPDGEVPCFSGFSTVTLQGPDGILSLPIEEYVLGALLSEMPSSFHEEALMAQAVACRTYAAYKIRASQKHESGAALCQSAGHCQAYVSPETVSETRLAAAEKAVEKTAGEILCYDGEPILAVFHASSGAKTVSSAEVWGGERPYLVSVDSFECENPALSDSCITVSEVSREKFIETLRTLCPALVLRGDGEILSGIVIEKSESGRALSVCVCGNEIDAAAFVRSFRLRSRCFSFAVGETNVTFTVYGYGHGVGLSQLGAEDLAEKGYDYRAVLAHYYTGAKFGRITA